MPANNVKQIKIWTISHSHLQNIIAAYKARGEASASMTQLVSKLILSIPIPNGSKPEGELEKENEHGCN
jgi:hypothetical protein